MAPGVCVLPAGVEAIVHKVPVRPVTIMESGVVHTVPAIPAGAAAIARLKILAAGMEHGINGIITEPADVPVIPVGVGVIAQNPLGLPVSITGYGMQTPTTPMADSVNVIPAGMAAIVQPAPDQIVPKNLNPNRRKRFMNQPGRKKTMCFNSKGGSNTRLFL